MRSLLAGTLALLFISSVSCTEGGNGMALSSSLQGEELDFSSDVSVTASFAGLYYEPVEYSSEPDMGGLSLPLDGDEVINLSEVLQLAGAGGTPVELLENGFAVFRPSLPTDDPLEAFRSLGGRDQPVYVSSGIPLHMLHIFFDQILQDLEEKYFFADLKTICRELYDVNIQRGSTLNASFFAVPAAIMDPSFEPDESIAEEVAEELALIEAHSGFSGSPVMGYREDYSQYVPRGHYASSDTLRRYFKSMMWLGRITFLLNGGDSHGQTGEFIVSEERAREMTASALFTVSDLATVTHDGETLLEKWKRMYQITAFFAGFADDLSVPEYTTAAEETAGETVPAETVIDPDFYRSFRNYVNENYRGPGIYSGTGELVSMPDQQGTFDPQDLQRSLGKTAGFRFMGQRYTPDSEILGKLVFPAVGMNPQGRNRFMPSGLDVAAVFGSTAAESILRDRGDFRYSGYADSLESLRRKVEDLGPEQWHSTLYMSWLHCLYLLQQERSEGYPSFMGTEAWRVHTLSNFLASWAMLRHDTILYAKQSYTMTAGCAPPGPYEEPEPSAGFVEPVPEVYAELSATLSMARRGLEDYGVLDEDIGYRFDSALNLMERLQDIAERELAGEALTPDDADFLKGFAGSLESAISWGGETEEGLETTLIADVHTDQNSQSVLEVASGELDYCVVIYRRPDGAVEAAVGPVLSYYEFAWPMAHRLTDQAWRDMLENGEAPERPSWTEPIRADE